MLLTGKRQIAGKLPGISYAIDIQEGARLRLLVLHSFGLHSWQANAAECVVSFPTSSELWNHSGEVELKLFFENQLLSEEKLTILPDTSYAPLVEAYCGPKQILTGGEDFTMVIGTGVDSLDNPWPRGTAVDYEYLFKRTFKKRSVNTKTLHSYTRFFSDDESGTPVITVASHGSSHSEFNVTLYPNRPETFSLEYDRSHKYADGKQVTAIKTSVIKDELRNIIADGTLVYFKIVSNLGTTTYATAGMVNGIATIRLPAPKEAMLWTVQAFIEDYTKSTESSIEYLPSVKPYPVAFEEGMMKIGPIKGFSYQFVPDHTEINITLCHKDEHYKTVLYTAGGKATFDPEKLNLTRGLYDVVLNCGGQIAYKQILVQ